MNTGQRYRAPVRWLSFALATVLCGAASCLPQAASAARPRAPPDDLAGAAAARTSTSTAAAPPFAVIGQRGHGRHCPLHVASRVPGGPGRATDVAPQLLGI